MIDFITDNAFWIAAGIFYVAVVAGLLAFNHAAHRGDRFDDDEVWP